jgi:DNA-binding NtrC family response regulator
VVPARVTFERAADVLLRAGNAEGSGSAFLAAIQELSARLPVGELLTWYEQADSLLQHTNRADELLLLRRAAREVVAALRREEREGQSTGDVSTHEGERVLRQGFSLKEEVWNLEAHYIMLALKETGGKVSRAAKLLGFADHGSLNALLKNKHPQLLSARLPKASRRRSIFKGRQ